MLVVTLSCVLRCKQEMHRLQTGANIASVSKKAFVSKFTVVRRGLRVVGRDDHMFDHT